MQNSSPLTRKYSGLSVFDLDHTLLTVNISYRFGFHLCRSRFFSRWSFYLGVIDYGRHLYLGMTLTELHQRVFARLFKGHSRRVLEPQAAQFLQSELPALVYPAAMHRLKEAKKRGDYILILSSSPDFLVKPIAKELGATAWNSTIYEEDEEGILCSITQVMDGEDKADYVEKIALQLGIPLEEISVYSDSHLDLPLLRMVGKPVGVSPNAALKKVCRREGWEVI